MDRRRGRAGRGVGLALAFAAAGVGAADGQDVGWDDPRWRIEAADARTETWRGRDALVLTNGTAWLDGAAFRDGVVEFDLAAPADLGFHGVAFRAAGDGDYEHVYVRPFLSGNPDASQYTPVFHGVTGWQLYADARFAQPVTLTPDRWMHVRLDVRGGRARLTVDGQPLVFPQLLRDPVSGALGLTSSGAPARFANLEVRPGGDADPGTEPGAAEPPTPPGTVACWRVSTPFAEARLEGLAPLGAGDVSGLDWDPLAPDAGGIANLARLRQRTAEANTVFAAVTLRARRAGAARVRFGFSDRVRAYLGGRPIYRGSDGWRSRDYRFLGTVGLHDELVLPLERGDNELWLAVTEDFGGWGVTLQLAEGDAAIVPPPGGCGGDG